MYKMNEEIEDIIEEMSGMEVLEQYKTKNRIHNLEFGNGIDVLNNNPRLI
jgi:hypothetical protein